MVRDRLERQALVINVIAWTVFLNVLLVRSAVFFSTPTLGLIAGLSVTLAVAIATSAVMFRLVRDTHERLRALPFYALMLACVVVLSVSVSFFDGYVGTAIQRAFGEQGIDPMRRSGLGIIGFFNEFAMVTAFYVVMLHNDRERRRHGELAAAREEAARHELHAAEAKSTAINARLEALRYQLNPHFLFNTLNAISSSIVTGRPDAAEAMLAKLCDFLRATLAAPRSGLIAIEDELQTIADYLQIEQARLGERLRVEIECAPQLRDHPIPGFMVQPLVENAIKHAVGGTSSTVAIRIDVLEQADGTIAIVVADNGKGKGAAKPGLGVGQANVREGLAAVYGDAAWLETDVRPDGYVATIHLPAAAPMLGVGLALEKAA